MVGRREEISDSHPSRANPSLLSLYVYVYVYIIHVCVICIYGVNIC